MQQFTADQRHISMLAATAPDLIPDWFIHVPPKKDFKNRPNPNEIENKEDREQCTDWQTDGSWDLPDYLTWFQEQERVWFDAHDLWERENEKSRYFQWRVFYADNLMAELAKKEVAS